MKRTRGTVQGTERRASGRSVNPTVLIVCGGTQTEKLYFEAFPVHGLRVIARAYDPVSLVRWAKEERAEEARRQRARAGQVETWCVFDFDPGLHGISPDCFQTALHAAEAAGIEVAWSNECFEVWFLLHFLNLEAAWTRAEYGARLSAALGGRYEKAMGLYDRLLPHQPAALKHAERLLAERADDLPHRINPGTTVHRLVQRLNRGLRP